MRPFDMTSIVMKMYAMLETTMASFEATSREWQVVARNINGIVQTNRGNLGVVVERTAKSLDDFSVTMQRAAQTFDNANRVIGDPQTVQNLRKAFAGLPQIVNETQQTITAMRQTVTSINGNLKNIEGVTEPLARHTTSIVVRLDNSLANLETLTGERRLPQARTVHSSGFCPTRRCTMIWRTRPRRCRSCCGIFSPSCRTCESSRTRSPDTRKSLALGAH